MGRVDPGEQRVSREPWTHPLRAPPPPPTCGRDYTIRRDSSNWMGGSTVGRGDDGVTNVNTDGEGVALGKTPRRKRRLLESAQPKYCPQKELTRARSASTSSKYRHVGLPPLHECSKHIDAPFSDIPFSKEEAAQLQAERRTVDWIKRLLQPYDENTIALMYALGWERSQSTARRRAAAAQQKPSSGGAPQRDAWPHTHRRAPRPKAYAARGGHSGHWFYVLSRSAACIASRLGLWRDRGASTLKSFGETEWAALDDDESLMESARRGGETRRIRCKIVIEGGCLHRSLLGGWKGWRRGRIVQQLPSTTASKSMHSIPIIVVVVNPRFRHDSGPAQVQRESQTAQLGIGRSDTRLGLLELFIRLVQLLLPKQDLFRDLLMQAEALSVRRSPRLKAVLHNKHMAQALQMKASAELSRLDLHLAFTNEIQEVIAVLYILYEAGMGQDVVDFGFLQQSVEKQGYILQSEYQSLGYPVFSLGFLRRRGAIGKGENKWKSGLPGFCRPASWWEDLWEAVRKWDQMRHGLDSSLDVADKHMAFNYEPTTMTKVKGDIIGHPSPNSFTRRDVQVVVAVRQPSLRIFRRSLSDLAGITAAAVGALCSMRWVLIYGSPKTSHRCLTDMTVPPAIMTFHLGSRSSRTLDVINDIVTALFWTSNWLLSSKGGNAGHLCIASVPRASTPSVDHCSDLLKELQPDLETWGVWGRPIRCNSVLQDLGDCAKDIRTRRGIDPKLSGVSIHPDQGDLSLLPNQLRLPLSSDISQSPQALVPASKLFLRHTTQASLRCETKVKCRRRSQVTLRVRKTKSLPGPAIQRHWVLRRFLGTKMRSVRGIGRTRTSLHYVMGNFSSPAILEFWAGGSRSSHENDAVSKVTFFFPMNDVGGLKCMAVSAARLGAWFFPRVYSEIALSLFYKSQLASLGPSSSSHSKTVMERPFGIDIANDALLPLYQLRRNVPEAPFWPGLPDEDAHRILDDGEVMDLVHSQLLSTQRLPTSGGTASQYSLLSPVKYLSDDRIQTWHTLLDSAPRWAHGASVASVLLISNSNRPDDLWESVLQEPPPINGIYYRAGNALSSVATELVPDLEPILNFRQGALRRLVMNTVDSTRILVSQQIGNLLLPVPGQILPALDPFCIWFDYSSPNPDGSFNRLDIDVTRKLAGMKLESLSFLHSGELLKDKDGNPIPIPGTGNKAFFQDVDYKSAFIDAIMFRDFYLEPASATPPDFGPERPRIFGYSQRMARYYAPHGPVEYIEGTRHVLDRMPMALWMVVVLGACKALRAISLGEEDIAQVVALDEMMELQIKVLRAIEESGTLGVLTKELENKSERYGGRAPFGFDEMLFQPQP
ncbi:hypothetical protein BV25DRAFT_1843223 [Artomyces pyxidatus]|uniref:Uncharacterized protein n=1 Tax=Artomyces pyxidatus TaxID=48021 RepID=A0ACB8SGN9_9AGAM|nr:hypothetical protein BV25DRAFT_1843223 [Artomyces pyxidatus]